MNLQEVFFYIAIKNIHGIQIWVNNYYSLSCDIYTRHLTPPNFDSKIEIIVVGVFNNSSDLILVKKVKPTACVIVREFKFEVFAFC